MTTSVEIVSPSGFWRFSYRQLEWMQDGLTEGLVTRQFMEGIYDQMRIIEKELSMLRAERVRLLMRDGVSNEAYELLKTAFKESP